MTYDEWRAEARRRQAFGLLIDRAMMRIRARKAREQRDADAEGAGAVLCAIRQARGETIRGAG
ncbi:hypothetical protein IX56_02085 [Paracoccus sanguinis]|uniref:Uncharacterized protein n=1 Tax=Paracoccus sanguinis TaxID=1545044 RepID=A0A099GKU5_9RHOB|nr:hypothetical protein IX56_02085 [Paracoccus sanguinis]